MSKKTQIIVSVLAIGLLFLMFWVNSNNRPTAEMAQSEIQQVETVVMEFGNRMKNVSLAAEPALIVESIKKEYTPYTSPILMERWLADPTHAPGRQTSSPWPERIEIKEIRKVGDYYEIVAQVVMLTSADVAQGGESGRAPAYISVANIQGKWLVAEYQNSME